MARHPRGAGASFPTRHPRCPGVPVPWQGCSVTAVSGSNTPAVGLNHICRLEMERETSDLRTGGCAAVSRGGGACGDSGQRVALGQCEVGRLGRELRHGGGWRCWRQEEALWLSCWCWVLCAGRSQDWGTPAWEPAQPPRPPTPALLAACQVLGEASPSQSSPGKSSCRPGGGSGRAWGELGQREQQHSDGVEVAGVPGRDLSAAGHSLMACGAVTRHLCRSLVTVLVCAQRWGTATKRTGHTGPSPRFAAAQICQRLHLIALCL